jgi:hypothetical protein
MRTAPAPLALPDIAAADRAIREYARIAWHDGF